MIDFVKATSYSSKDSIFLGNCSLQQTFPQSGWMLYYLEGCEKMKIWHHPGRGWYRVEGSLPYFYQGHNYTFSTGDLVQAVDTIDSLLGRVGLWGAEVNEFENGIILPVMLKPKEYICKHYPEKGAGLKKVENQKNQGKMLMWVDSVEDIKIYDAGARIKQIQGKGRKELIETAGWNPEENYLKFEARYKKPSLLNYGKPLPLERLQNVKFLNYLNDRLMNDYKRLVPARALVMPTDKKKLSSLDLALITLAESVMNAQGKPLEEVKKQLYQTINAADTLSKADKDARKSVIRKALKNLEEAPGSPWDLSAQLRAALEAEAAANLEETGECYGE